VLKIRRRKFNRTIPRRRNPVTRRLFRSGDSEYLLNGKLCRLRDIQDIFMGTGLGPESYALIEQGRIGQILSSQAHRPPRHHRRGRRHHQVQNRKRLAEARLEDAKLNLARINDIFDEVTRQMNSLKRQASKAERYAKLRDEMREKLRVVLASKFAAIEPKRRTRAQLNALAEEMQHRTEAVQQLEAEHAERTQRGYAIEPRRPRESRSLSRSRSKSIAPTPAAATTKSAAPNCWFAPLPPRPNSPGRHRLTALEQERESNRQVLESAAADLAAPSTSSPCQQESPQPRRAGAETRAPAGRVSRRHLRHCVVGFAPAQSLAQAEERLAGADREARRLRRRNLQRESAARSFRRTARPARPRI
jgi:chromosome segregation protein